MINLCGANANKSFCVAQRKSISVARTQILLCGATQILLCGAKSSFVEQKSSFVEQKKSHLFFGLFLGCFWVVFGLFFVSWESKNNKTKSHLFLVLARNQVIPQWDRGGSNSGASKSTAGAENGPRGYALPLLKPCLLNRPPTFQLAEFWNFLALAI